VGHGISNDERGVEQDQQSKAMLLPGWRAGVAHVIFAQGLTLA
jgi:hypothetical protein